MIFIMLNINYIFIDIIRNLNDLYFFYVYKKLTIIQFSKRSIRSCMCGIVTSTNILVIILIEICQLYNYITFY